MRLPFQRAGAMHAPLLAGTGARAVCLLCCTRRTCWFPGGAAGEGTLQALDGAIARPREAEADKAGVEASPRLVAEFIHPRDHVRRLVS